MKWTQKKKIIVGWHSRHIQSFVGHPLSCQNLNRIQLTEFHYKHMKQLFGKAYYQKNHRWSNKVRRSLPYCIQTLVSVLLFTWTSACARQELLFIETLHPQTRLESFQMKTASSIYSSIDIDHLLAKRQLNIKENNSTNCFITMALRRNGSIDFGHHNTAILVLSTILV